MKNGKKIIIITIIELFDFIVHKHETGISVNLTR